MLVPICAKLPMYLDKVVNPLIETFCNNTKRYQVDIYFFRERDIAACMQYAFHMIETREQNKHNFQEVESFLLRQMLYKQVMVRPNFTKNVVYLFITCMSAKIVFFAFRNYIVFMAIIFEEVKSLR